MRNLLFHVGNLVDVIFVIGNKVWLSAVYLNDNHHAGIPVHGSFTGNITYIVSFVNIGTGSHMCGTSLQSGKLDGTGL